MINSLASFFFSQCQDDLWSLLDIRLPALLNKSNIKLLILDSVAAIFRSEFDLHELADRAKTLAKLGNKLQRISHQYNLCVVCVNQVRVCSRKNDHDEKKKNKRKNTQPNPAFYFSIMTFSCKPEKSKTDYRNCDFNLILFWL